MNNPIEIMVRNMMQQSGGNPQALAQNLLKNNPQFSQMLQGQNVQELAMKEMRRCGLNPQMFMNNMFGKR